MRGDKVIVALTLAGAVALFASAARAGCNDPDVPTVRSDINNECQCTGNHGQYVSCVARHVKAAVGSGPGQIDQNCTGKVKSCAARSTCGHKYTFVTCSRCEPGAC